MWEWGQIRWSYVRWIYHHQPHNCAVACMLFFGDVGKILRSSAAPVQLLNLHVLTLLWFYFVRLSNSQYGCDIATKKTVKSFNEILLFRWCKEHKILCGPSVFSVALYFVQNQLREMLDDRLRVCLCWKAFLSITYSSSDSHMFTCTAIFHYEASEDHCQVNSSFKAVWLNYNQNKLTSGICSKTCGEYGSYWDTFIALNIPSQVFCELSSKLLGGLLP